MDQQDKPIVELSFMAAPVQYVKGNKTHRFASNPHQRESANYGLG